jgi:hypothetical protein
MFKRVGVLALTLASFGALIPATAAAAERGRQETKVVVERTDRRPAEHPAPVVEHRVIARRGPVRYYSAVPRCR